MPEITRPSGLTISLPATYRIGTLRSEPESPPRNAEPRRGGRRAEPRSSKERRFEGAEAFPEGTAMLNALKEQDMQVVDSFTLEPLRYRAEAADVREKQNIRLQQDLQKNEGAVVLIAQKGVYSWVFPKEETKTLQSDSRQNVRGQTAARSANFHFDVQSLSKAGKKATQRGKTTDFISSTIIVMKFVAHLPVDSAIKFLERNVEPGLVLITSQDAGQWLRVEDMRSITLPTDRRAKILLLVHGTFSSTTGSFGALSYTEPGQKFLTKVLEKYDIVIGFDHRTLSDDPKANALDLLKRLQQGTWPHPPKVDAIAFSRGGLVLRWLVQRLLPVADWPARIERAVFVACTNGGTILAEPENWHALVDLYTNLAVGLSRLLGMIPQAAVPLNIFSGILQGLGALVKFIATEAVSGGAVPGLAAMEPDGEFVIQLNSNASAAPKETQLYAITSQFEPKLSGETYEPEELAPEFTLRLADRLVDRLMNNAPNDVVVDTASMTTFDPDTQQLVQDKYEFGVTSKIYHLNYFTRSEVTEILTHWLQLE